MKPTNFEEIPEIELRDNTCGVPAGKYMLTEATGNYDYGGNGTHYNIDIRPIYDPSNQYLKNHIDYMYFNPDYVHHPKAKLDINRANIFSSSMQKLNMHAFDINNIYVNEEKGTIVVKWGDGVTTKVKLEKGDVFDLEAGVSFALLKRLLISHHHLQRVIKDKVIYSGKEGSCSEKKAKVSK